MGISYTNIQLTLLSNFMLLCYVESYFGFCVSTFLLYTSIFCGYVPDHTRIWTVCVRSGPYAYFFKIPITFQLYGLIFPVKCGNKTPAHMDIQMYIKFDSLDVKHHSVFNLNAPFILTSA